MADLYVYFYEQGLRLVRPGGRMSYVVTNKWLKAGYAEALRGLFASKAEVEFVADFGHAKHFFPDADVFPSVVAVRRPAQDHSPPTETQVCLIPRDAVPEKGLSATVAAATYPLPRTHFTKDVWTLEPPEVVTLLDKIRKNGVALSEYAGVKPFYGIKTGFNEAFLIDASTRDRLVREDPGCSEIIKPYSRGQDIERWWSPPSGLHMIVLRSSGDHPWPWADAPDESEAEKRFKAAFPSLYAHMKTFETLVDPISGQKRGLRHRDDQGRFWWELRPCAYYDMFERSRLAYPDLSWSPSFQMLNPGTMVSDLTFFVPSEETALPVPLNAPISWWYLWRNVIHGKDEVLRLKTIYMEHAPLARSVLTESTREVVVELKSRLARVDFARTAIHDWLRHEFGLGKIKRNLAEPHACDADDFVTAVCAALPKGRKWSAAEIARLKQEYTDTLVPARQAASDILAIERKLSDLVNAAYGLTPAEVALMWRTAPPRMPLDPAEELRRLHG
jgi:hypothetical protein